MSLQATEVSRSHEPKAWWEAISTLIFGIATAIKIKFMASNDQKSQTRDHRGCKIQNSWVRYKIHGPAMTYLMFFMLFAFDFGGKLERGSIPVLIIEIAIVAMLLRNDL